MRLVNFKLYSAAEITYPLETLSQDQIIDAQNKIRSKFEKEHQQELKEMKASFGQNEEVKAMVKREEELLRFKLLFKDSLFFLNREVPKKLLEYIIVGFGGKFTSEEEKKGVTH